MVGAEGQKQCHSHELGENEADGEAFAQDDQSELLSDEDSYEAVESLDSIPSGPCAVCLASPEAPVKHTSMHVRRSVKQFLTCQAWRLLV